MYRISLGGVRRPVLGAALVLSLAAPCSGATFIVTSSADSGPGTLRQAIIQANATPEEDEIYFDASFYEGEHTITLTSGQLAIAGPVSITGPNVPDARVTIAGGGSSRLMHLSGSWASGLALSDLTLANGTAASIPGSGGAIACGAQTVEIVRCRITNCSAVEWGGAIACTGNATLTLDNTTFDGCTAATGGAVALLFQGSLLATGCTFSGNSSTVGEGGAVFVAGQTSVVTVRSSTFSGNTAKLHGGAIASNTNSQGFIEISNSTFSGNVAQQGDGGALSRKSSDAELSISNSIVSGNSAATVADDIFCPGPAGVATSLLGTVDGATDLTADATSLGLVGVAPLLGPLADNGGRTKTMLPAAGSPVVNAGSSHPSIATDQRGLPRESDPACASTLPDIGAVELQCEPSCPADLDGDGQVGGADLGVLLAGWLQPGNADLDGSGVVDGADLGALLSAWGPCP